jgi:putative membrane protein insertion efficiency factor
MKRLAIFLINIYKFFISPILPGVCRYHPSCSQYAVEAIERYGAGYGIWLACKRLLRCNPLFAGGFDPVPEKRNKVIKND